MERNSLNEALKRRAAEKQAAAPDKMALDDARRVKILSPGRLVFKRFVRNRLAVIGTCILIAVFVFAFLGPLFYPYGQSEVFRHYESMPRTYATAKFKTQFEQPLNLEGAPSYPQKVAQMTNSNINYMKENDLDAAIVDGTDGTFYQLVRLNDAIYRLDLLDAQPVGAYATAMTISEKIDTLAAKRGDELLDVDGNPINAALVEEALSAFNSIKGSDKTAEFTYDGAKYVVEKLNKLSFSLKADGGVFIDVTGADEKMLDAANTAIAEKKTTFIHNGENYLLHKTSDGMYDLSVATGATPVAINTLYTFATVTPGTKLSTALRAEALLHYDDSEEFTVDGATYHVDPEAEMILDADGNEIAYFTDLVVVDGTAQDTLSIEFKEALGDLANEMKANYQEKATLDFKVKALEVVLNEKGEEALVDKLDENGNPVYELETLTVTSDASGTFTITRNVPFYVNYNFAPMSSEHPFGTDGNGMDVLARMMYGGRISLLVGFVVVFLSMFIGIIMGGLAGYFGGWVDTLIMRLVEIFYCIPTYPILFILGGFMDGVRMEPVNRVFVMMAVLGILGWAGTARMVRGQILSLREQEFMIAAEATGVRVRHRIFRHLVPNVMPQLIVSATSSLGGVILTESSLSFLGLGVKFPMATWGNMIQFVTTLNENLGRYAYIWVPVGFLICITVIAFNFVGDGLRDAFDPKMKR